MSQNITEFKSALQDGGARANQFQIVFNSPSAIENFLPKTSFLVRTGQLPGSSVGELAIPFRGRNIYLAGDREYEPWTTTVLNDVDFHVRNIIEQWQNFMNDFTTGKGETNVANYTADVLVRQLDRNSNSGEDFVKEYKLINCFPQAIGAIDLSYDATTEVETFDITWRYTHFEIAPFTSVSPS
tara:strand:+ start:109 stop:660 length:552 start_codon:yes stop_codon:yes gene_type:complete